MTTDSLLPPDDDLDILHTRNYETRVYLLDDEHLLVRGAVSDMKPPGIYVEDDPEPMEMHQLHVELQVRLEGLEIVDANVVFETHPHTACPRITEHYKELIGLSIARGFTHKIRELFGGPRGCTHTTALLQSMAPAVVQSTWSVTMRKRREAGIALGAMDGDRAIAFERNINTCHVWADDGEHIAAIRRGEPTEPLIQVAERLVELGRDPGEWRSPFD